MRKNEIMYLLLGSNIGDRLSFLKEAEKEVTIHIGKVLKKSSYYESEAWGNTELENFWNICLVIDTNLSPDDVLKKIHEIEKKMGRVRTGEWQAREIDIDILFYGEKIVNTNHLIIPHPRIQDRNFALIPMMEVNGDFIHPVLELPIDELFFDCKDSLEVYLLDVH